MKPHDLRHTVLTHMLAAGVPPRDVADFAGHGDGGVLVLRTYGHVLPDQRRRMAAALDDVFASEDEDATGTDG